MFVIMLTEGGTGVRTRQLNDQVPLGAMAAVWLAFVLIVIFTRTVWPTAAGVLPAYNVVAVGNAFLSDYVTIFQVTSVVLLVSLVGAIVIARRGDLMQVGLTIYLIVAAVMVFLRLSGILTRLKV